MLLAPAFHYPVPRMVIVVTALMLTSCGDDPRLSAHSEDSGRKQFGVADRQAARVLSLGAEKEANEIKSAYGLALSCKVAMDKLTDQTGNFGPVATDQRAAIEIAQKIFAQRLREEAARQNTSEQEMKADIADLAENSTDPTESARRLIGCLRKLESTQR